MPYKVTHRPQFAKAIRKLQKKNPRLVEEILVEADRIQANPTQYEALTANLKGFSSAHFHRNPEYRIMFKVYECQKQAEKSKEYYCELAEITQCEDRKECNGLIDFVFVDTREEFNKKYKLTKKDLKNFIYWCL